MREIAAYADTAVHIQQCTVQQHTTYNIQQRTVYSSAYTAAYSYSSIQHTSVHYTAAAYSYSSIQYTSHSMQLTTITAAVSDIRGVRFVVCSFRALIHRCIDNWEDRKTDAKFMASNLAWGNQCGVSGKHTGLGLGLGNQCGVSGKHTGSHQYWSLPSGNRVAANMTFIGLHSCGCTAALIELLLLRSGASDQLLLQLPLRVCHTIAPYMSTITP